VYKIYMPTTQQLLEQLKKTALEIQSGLGTLAQKGYGQTDIANIPQNVQLEQLPQNVPASVAGTAGTTDTTDYRKMLADLIAKQNQAYQTYQTTIAGLPTAASQYKTYSEQLGLPAKEAAVTTAQQGLTGITQQVQSTENLLNDLEKNIASRVGSYVAGTGQGLTSAQASRQLATEQKPLNQQLAEQLRGQATAQTGLTGAQAETTSARQRLQDLLTLAQSDYTRQTTAAGVPLQQLSATLPMYEALAQYQSPQEKLQQQIADEQAMIKAGVKAAPTKQAQWSEPYLMGGDYVQKNTQTGEIRTAVNVASGGAIGKADIQTILYNISIPTAVSTEKGVLNKSYYDKAVSAGLDPETVNGLWQNIIAGNTFEEIRQYIKSQGGDPATLDTFVQILQGGSTGGIKSKLDAILDKV